MIGDRGRIDEPRGGRRLWRVLPAVLALAVLADFVVPSDAHSAVARLPGFDAVFGFIACMAMIAVARLLGRWLKRPDDHYEAADD